MWHKLQICLSSIYRKTRWLSKKAQSLRAELIIAVTNMHFDPSHSPWDPEPVQRTWWQVVNLKISGRNLWRQSDQGWF